MTLQGSRAPPPLRTEIPKNAPRRPRSDDRWPQSARRAFHGRRWCAAALHARRVGVQRDAGRRKCEGVMPRRSRRPRCRSPHRAQRCAFVRSHTRRTWLLRPSTQVCLARIQSSSDGRCSSARSLSPCATEPRRTAVASTSRLTLTDPPTRHGPDWMSRARESAFRPSALGAAGLRAAGGGGTWAPPSCFSLARRRLRGRCAVLDSPRSACQVPPRRDVRVADGT